LLNTLISIPPSGAPFIWLEILMRYPDDLLFARRGLKKVKTCVNMDNEALSG
jgi:hypothetical protein